MADLTQAQLRAQELVQRKLEGKRIVLSYEDPEVQKEYTQLVNDPLRRKELNMASERTAQSRLNEQFARSRGFQNLEEAESVGKQLGALPISQQRTGLRPIYRDGQIVAFEDRKQGISIETTQAMNQAQSDLRQAERYRQAGFEFRQGNPNQSPKTQQKITTLELQAGQSVRAGFTPLQQQTKIKSQTAGERAIRILQEKAAQRRQVQEDIRAGTYEKPDTIASAPQKDASFLGRIEERLAAKRRDFSNIPSDKKTVITSAAVAAIETGREGLALTKAITRLPTTAKKIASAVSNPKQTYFSLKQSFLSGREVLKYEPAALTPKILDFTIGPKITGAAVSQAAKLGTTARLAQIQKQLAVPKIKFVGTVEGDTSTFLAKARIGKQDIYTLSKLRNLPDSEMYPTTVQAASGGEIQLRKIGSKQAEITTSNVFARSQELGGIPKINYDVGSAEKDVLNSMFFRGNAQQNIDGRGFVSKGVRVPNYRIDVDATDVGKIDLIAPTKQELLKKGVIKTERLVPETQRSEILGIIKQVSDNPEQYNVLGSSVARMRIYNNGRISYLADNFNIKGKVFVRKSSELDDTFSVGTVIAKTKTAKPQVPLATIEKSIKDAATKQVMPQIKELQQKVTTQARAGQTIGKTVGNSGSTINLVPNLRQSDSSFAITGQVIGNQAFSNEEPPAFSSPLIISRPSYQERGTQLSTQIAFVSEVFKPGVRSTPILNNGLIDRQRLDTLPFFKPAEKVDLGSRGAVIPRFNQAQRQLQKQRNAQKPRPFIPRLVPTNQPPRKIRIDVPNLTNDDLFKKFRPFKKSKKLSDFLTFIKRRGKDLFIGASEEILSASTKGQRQNKGDLSASYFVIQRSTGKKVFLPIAPGFERSKTDPFALQQPRNKRLSSRSEIFEIIRSRRRGGLSFL